MKRTDHFSFKEEDEGKKKVSERDRYTTPALLISNTHTTRPQTHTHTHTSEPPPRIFFSSHEHFSIFLLPFSLPEAYLTFSTFPTFSFAQFLHLTPGTILYIHTHTHAHVQYKVYA